MGLFWCLPSLWPTRKAYDLQLSSSVWMVKEDVEVRHGKHIQQQLAAAAAGKK
jgi:hypothetical protein